MLPAYADVAVVWLDDEDEERAISLSIAVACLPKLLSFGNLKTLPHQALASQTNTSIPLAHLPSFRIPLSIGAIKHSSFTKTQEPARCTSTSTLGSMRR